MSEFIKYSSIENSYRQAFLDKCAYATENKIMVALEKIHGANFSWIVTESGVRCARRSAMLDELESFYAHTRFYSRYEPTIKSIFDIIKASYPSLTQINVFGEIFGGFYNGTRAQNSSTVQSGVNYHPDTEFMLFDIKATFDTGVSRYLPFVDVQELVEDANFMQKTVENHLKIVPVIATGTLSELIAIDPLFYTRVPAEYGIDDGHTRTDIDYAEGLVIRGYDEEIYIGNERVILKQKNKLYGEKVNEVKIKAAIHLDENQQALLDKICSYLNENRVNAVVSKGQYDPKSFGKLQGDFVRDALEDFEKDEGYKATTNEHWGVLAKRVGSHAAQVIRPIWVNMFD